MSEKLSYYIHMDDVLNGGEAQGLPLPPEIKARRAAEIKAYEEHGYRTHTVMRLPVSPAALYNEVGDDISWLLPQGESNEADETAAFYRTLEELLMLPTTENVKVVPATPELAAHFGKDFLLDLVAIMLKPKHATG